ncbi:MULTISPECIES: DUF5661 family protein [unclassified Clostridium]|uniref:DUF5661 family protein n=1 Tax=unclassified Clostridium TaxID=2614128 RepID=UPI002913792E|nr:DUF5661 family protein [Clostridium sp.]MDU5106460.1 DUF5661 family protein [Clostridium sp.]
MKLLKFFSNRSDKLEKRKTFTKDEASRIAKRLGIDFSKEKFTLDDFTIGVNVELEHGTKSLFTNVTNDNPIITGKIALAHLNEIPDYYVRLSKLELEAKAYWNKSPTNK